MDTQKTQRKKRKRKKPMKPRFLELEDYPYPQHCGFVSAEHFWDRTERHEKYIPPKLFILWLKELGYNKKISP